jgi:hypothetical protein
MLICFLGIVQLGVTFDLLTAEGKEFSLCERILGGHESPLASHWYFFWRGTGQYVYYNASRTLTCPVSSLMVLTKGKCNLKAVICRERGRVNMAEWSGHLTGPLWAPFLGVFSAVG